VNESPATEIVVGRGARDAENRLIDAAFQRLDMLEADCRFDRPVVIVVPSHSLRQHLHSRLLARRGRSLLGLRCSTHRALAMQILERAGVRPPEGLDVFAVLARRFARQEPALADALDDLVDGYSGMLGSVRDLLDAGFGIPHLKGVDEALEIEGPAIASPKEVQRARALMRVTARVLAAFEELGVGRSSTLLQEATDLVALRPEEVLEASAVLVHGFADATGVTSDLLTALLRAYGGLLVLDQPPDPVDPSRPDPSGGFIDRFAEHFRGFATPLPPQFEPAGPSVHLFRALGRRAEVREVVHRVRDLLDAGTEPEEIGIVLREPMPYRSILRRELTNLQVPFSGYGVSGPRTTAGRRLKALQEVLASGGRCHVERWLDAVAHRGQTPQFDLRVALSALGIARLDQLAALDVFQLPFTESYPLPVRQGFYEAEDEGSEQGEIRAQHRHVPAREIDGLVQSARQVLQRFEGWRSSQLSFQDHAEHLDGLIGDLGWPEEEDATLHVRRLLDRLTKTPPIEIDLEELVLVIRRQLAEAGLDAFGGSGAGVQVLSVIDARARTFGHLFLLGLNRGVFPRTVREDPVLSDALRRLLERGGHGVLPDLPIKRRGYDEERYLFAHLLSASPEVTLSWLEIDDGDRAVPASPLIERLRWTGRGRPGEWDAPPIAGRHPVADRRSAACVDRLSPDELGVLAGLHGRDSHLRDVLALATGDAVAEARMAVLEEIDPQTAPAGKSCLSPYLGFIGPAERNDDPRTNRRLWVTALERMAACPWQTLIERLLRIEAVPDPLEALPRIDGLLIGVVVHRVLERLVADFVAPSDFASLRTAPAHRIAWPEDEDLDELLHQEAVHTVRHAGIALEGFARAVAAVTRPYLVAARSLDWQDGSLAGVVGVEVEGTLQLRIDGLAPRHLAFRADRVDRNDSQLVLTDYKTGRPAFEQKTASYRRKKFVREVGQGRRLQAVAYALAAGHPEDEGRFVYLRPTFEGPEEARTATVSSADRELADAFHNAVGTVLAAWERGLFFPRFEAPGRSFEPGPACQWCTVGEACLKQDSGFRRRLRLGVPALEVDVATVGPEIAAALLDHWWLPDRERRPSGVTTEGAAE
jgi:hypothetical protein